MKKIKTIESAVTLVTLPQFLPVLMWPHVGDYDNPYILRTIPCEKKNGHYFDLRSGEEVQKIKGMREWNNLSGSLFCYPDGYQLLLSRRYRDNKIMVFEPEEKQLSPLSTILRPVIHRKEKENL